MATTYKARRLRGDRVAASRLRTYRDDIQGIRGLAVLLVVIHHVGFAVFGGVDISFVLSGYLATDSMLREMERSDSFTARQYVTQFIPKYYARRVRRVIPLAAIVIVATMVMAILVAPAYRLKAIGLDGLAAATSSVNYWFAWSGTIYMGEAKGSESPFQHYWSLATEEQFYLVFPWVFVLAFMLGRRLGAVRLTMGFVIVVLAAASLYASIKISVPTKEPLPGLTEAAQPWAYFPLHTRAWELLIGCLVAVCARQFARMWLPLAAIMSWSGLAVIAVGSVMISRSDVIPGSVMLWPTIGAALFIAGGCANPWYGAELLFGKPMPRAYVAKKLAYMVRFIPVILQYLGKVSYGWYLWHWAPLVLAPYAIGRPLSLIEKMTIVLLTLVLSIVTNRFVETPIKRDKSLTQIPRKGLRMGYRFIAVAVVSAACLVAGGTVVAQASKPQVQPVNPAYIPRLVNESVQVTQLPASAEKQLDNIKNDLFPGCIVGEPETQAKSCILGDTTGTNQIVLFGNSLAWQWIPTVNRVAKDAKSQLTVITKAGCPPEEYGINNLDRTAYTECAPWRKSAYAVIDQLRPQMVILSSRAENEVTPKAIRDTVSHFQGLGAKVVVVLETPYAEFGENDDVPACIENNLNSLDRCITKLPARPESAMVAREARKAGATVIDPTPWLCAHNRCPSVIDGKVVYWDDHHLSATMTQWLTTAFRNQLPILN